MSRQARVAARVKAGWTRAALARRLGVSVGHLGRIERGGATSFQIADRLGQLLGCDATLYLPGGSTPVGRVVPDSGRKRGK